MEQIETDPKGLKFWHAFLLTLLATVPFLRPLLHLKKRKIIDQSTILEKSTNQPQIPVIYVHGFRGGDYTTQVMVNEACKQKNKSGYLRVTIDVFGNITIKGTWTNDERPIIQLIFDQKLIGVIAIGYLLRMALLFLKKRYNFTKYDAVGHSLGAPSLVKTEMKTKGKKNFPRIRKLALVAGPFNGVMFLGDIPNVNKLNRRGRPVVMNLSYLNLLKNRRKFSPNISVLNVYGNIEDETNTDRFISVVSAKSIRYVLAPIVKTFHELEIRGSAAEHSQMHDNPLVINILNRFLNY